jgi:hypothetical protein
MSNPEYKIVLIRVFSLPRRNQKISAPKGQPTNRFPVRIVKGPCLTLQSIRVLGGRIVL